MKKTKLAYLLALASCVVLGGCNKGTTPEEDPEPIDPVPPVVETATVSINDLPGKFYTGDVVDLDEYVTFTVASDYSVELDEDSLEIATLNGHTLTLSDEGEVSFTVKADDATDEGSFVVASMFREKMEQFIEDAGYNYAALQMNGNSVYDTIVHNENFVVTNKWSRDDYGNTLAGGFVKVNNAPYLYTIENRQVTFEDQYVYQNTIFTMLNSPINIDLSELEVQVDDEGDEYFAYLNTPATSYEFEDFLSGITMMDAHPEYYTDETYTTTVMYEVTEIDLYLMEDSLSPNVDMVIWGKVADDPTAVEEFLSEYVLTTDSRYVNSSNASIVKSFLDNPNMQLTDFASLCGVEYVLAACEALGYEINYQAGWVDDEGEAIATPESISGTIFEDVLTTVNSTKLVNKNLGFVNGYYNDQEQFVEVSGSIQSSADTVSDFSFDEDENDFIVFPNEEYSLVSQDEDGMAAGFFDEDNWTPALGNSLELISVIPMEPMVQGPRMIRSTRAVATHSVNRMDGYDSETLHGSFKPYVAQGTSFFPLNAEVGSTVTIQYTPAAGYKLEDIWVIDHPEVSFTLGTADYTNGFGLVSKVKIASFTMIDEDVKIGISFEEDLPVAATGVTLDRAEYVFSSEVPTFLIATVAPEDATNKQVTWTSSDTNVATVNENGFVTPVGEGYATITATTVDGGFTASCEVTVMHLSPVYMMGLNNIFQNPLLRSLLMSDSQLSEIVIENETTWAARDLDIFDYFSTDMIVLPEFGEIDLSISFGWEENVNYGISISIWVSNNASYFASLISSLIVE